MIFALLACAPKYKDLPPMAPADLLTPLPVQHVRVDGVDLAYVDSGGDGVPLVFIHGLSSYMGFWEYQLPWFAEHGYRVMALDLPGFGASDRPDAPYTPPWYADTLRGWMDALGVGTAVLVGHSMGGQISMTMALLHPERVSALVLSAPAGFERYSAGEAAWLKAWWTEDRAMQASEEEVRANFTQLAFNKVDPGVERLIQERVRMGKDPTFAGTSVAVSRSMAGMLDYPVLDRLGEIQAPTLIIFGTDDHMIPNPVFHGGRTATIAAEGAARIPGSSLTLLPGAGHTVHHDAPEAFNEATRAFLEAR